LLAQDLFVEKTNGIKGLILGAGGNTVFGNDSEKLLKLSLTGQMSWNVCQVVAVSPERGSSGCVRWPAQGVCVEPLVQAGAPLDRQSINRFNIRTSCRVL